MKLGRFDFFFYGKNVPIPMPWAIGLTISRLGMICELGRLRFGVNWHKLEPRRWGYNYDNLYFYSPETNWGDCEVLVQEQPDGEWKKV